MSSCDTFDSCRIRSLEVCFSGKHQWKAPVSVCVYLNECFNSAQRSAAVKYALKRSQLRTFWSCINIWWATWLKRVEEHFYVPSSCSFTAAARKRPHLNIFRWEDSNNPRAGVVLFLFYIYTRLWKYKAAREKWSVLNVRLIHHRNDRYIKGPFRREKIRNCASLCERSGGVPGLGQKVFYPTKGFVCIWLVTAITVTNWQPNACGRANGLPLRATLTVEHLLRDLHIN